MPEFTITVSSAMIGKLQAVVDAYNQQSGSSLTVKQWVVMTLKDAAIGPELRMAIGQLEEQSEQDADTALQTATEAKRQKLLDELA